jgi:hypothetical protein
MPLGSTTGFNNQDMFGNPTTQPPITNDIVNFGWEYVWHCHILSHEEMDMMRPQTAAVPPNAPTNLLLAVGGGGVILNWTDNSKNETGFLVKTATAPGGPWSDLATLEPNVTTFTEVGATVNQTHYYEVIAINETGYSGAGGAYETLTVSSVPLTGNITVGALLPPSSLTATYQAGPQVLLTWQDNATTETNFVLQRCAGSSCTNFTQIATPPALTGTGQATYTNTPVTPGVTYRYRVAARNGAQQSAWSNIATVTIPNLPLAPSNVNVALRWAGRWSFRLSWRDNSNNETGFRIQRSKDPTFVTDVSTNTVGANATSYAPSVGLEANSNYYFRIQSYNSNGSSAWVNATPWPLHTP